MSSIGIASTFVVSTGTLVSYGVSDNDTGPKFAQITVTCSAGGAAVIKSPEINGHFTALHCMPASDNASTTWTVAVTTLVGTPIGTISGESATAGKVEYTDPSFPMCADVLVFTVAGMTASKNITIKAIVED